MYISETSEYLLTEQPIQLLVDNINDGKIFFHLYNSWIFTHL